MIDFETWDDHLLDKVTDFLLEEAPHLSPEDEALEVFDGAMNKLITGLVAQVALHDRKDLLGKFLEQGLKLVTILLRIQNHSPQSLSLAFKDNQIHVLILRLGAHLQDPLDKTHPLVHVVFDWLRYVLGVQKVEDCHKAFAQLESWVQGRETLPVAFESLNDLHEAIE